MPPAGRGLLQLHPTRRCNLRCLHCYSNSGPEARDQLDASVVTELIDDAVAIGYTVLSVSGGEPLLYKPLAQTLRHAKAHGMRTLATSNGLLLQRRLLDALVDHLDLLAISLDGPADDHDRM